LPDQTHIKLGDSSPELGQYINNDINRVRGWCDTNLWYAIDPLAKIIKSKIGNKPVAEVGVYQGKFFIGLVKTMQAQKNNCAFDVFDMQEFNLDKAGIGDLQIFTDNMKTNKISDDEVEVIKADSTWFGPTQWAELEKKYGKFSMFSVDACHTAQHTLRDTQTAMALTDPAGIIFIDDYYNDFWPGVQEGIAKLYSTTAPPFVPLAFLCNKLILCSESYHQDYLKQLHANIRAIGPSVKWKLTPRFGYNTISIRPS